MWGVCKDKVVVVIASLNTTLAIPVVRPLGNNVELSVKVVELVVNPTTGRMVMAVVLGRRRESCAVFVVLP